MHQDQSHQLEAILLIHAIREVTIVILVMNNLMFITKNHLE